jgi:hypothetical protein
MQVVHSAVRYGPRVRRPTIALLLVIGCGVGPLGTATSASSAPVAVAAPVHSISVTGTGVTAYPSFDPAVGRYAVATTTATGGTMTVTATTSDPGGRVTVNGRPAPGGTRTLTGLQPGDEVAVFIDDVGGTARHSYIYLPPDFPVLERVTPSPPAGSLQPGLVMLTLSRWVAPAPLKFFLTGLDANAVPAFVREVPRSLDFKPQPSGYSYSETTTVQGRTGEDLVLLDSQMRQVGVRRTQGLVNTDGHDSILMSDGTLWLTAYEERSPGGPVDAIIQRIDPDGTVGFEWSSEPYAADAVQSQPDYAHINSIQLMSDGNLLASFRHLSSVFKIATADQPGFSEGDVIWKLGGRDSDFTFAGGDNGPCAQHTARELPNGDILMFDNGSWHETQSWCVDQAHPDGAAVERVQTRIVAFALNETSHIATPHVLYAPPGRFAVFAGSAQRLDNGNTLIGWAEETQALASEVDSSGNLVWEIRDPQTSTPYFTYRAHKAVVPDAVPPVVTVSVPDGASYVEGAAVPFSFECTDGGGSSLQTCSGPAAQSLDTSTPGTSHVTVTATDGAGNATSVTRTYQVTPLTQPDAMVRLTGRPRFRGDDRYGPASSQRVRAGLPAGQAVTAHVRLQNDGAKPTKLSFDVRGRSSSFAVLGRYAEGGTTPRLQPGDSWSFRLRIERREAAGPGERLLLSVHALSTAAPVRRDAVSLLLRASP